MIADGEASGRAHARADDRRCHLGQHRHRLRDGRRGARIQGEVVPARERQPRAQADPAGVRRRARADQSARGHRRRDSRGAPAGRRAIPTAISIQISTATTATGARTSTRPAPEIIEQTSGRMTHFVAGLGTSGTFVGTGAAAAAVQPGDQADLVSARLAVSRAGGLKHMASAMVPAIYDPSLADEDLRRQHRRRASAGAAAGARRGTAGRHFVRRRAGRHADGRARSDWASWSRCFRTARRNT